MLPSGQATGSASGGDLGTLGAIPWRWPLVAAIIEHLEAEQDRWFLWLPVMLGCGIAAYFLLPWEPTLAAAAAPLAIVLVLAWGGAEATLPRLALAALTAGTFGFALSKLRTEMVRAPVLAKPGVHQVKGFVELIEPRAAKGQRLTLRVTEMEGVAEEARPQRIRVRTSRETADLKPGDAVRLKASLSPPPLPALPGDYDFARAAWFSYLGAVGFSAEGAQRVDDAVPAPIGLRIAAAIERVRHAIGQRITAALPGEAGAIANALITGERGGISESTNQAFRDSGLFHILSISGLHMTIMAGAAFLVIRLSLAAIPSIALVYPIKKWAAVGAMLAALGYLLISGSAFATVRSYVMISIMFAAVLLDRPALALRNVAIAALGMLIVWPESLLDAGFQMSFAAVVALVSAYEALRARRARQDRAPAPFLLKSILRGLLFFAGIMLTTIIASLAVAPFGLYHFHNTQAYAVFANLIAIPACNLIVMPAALATLVAMPLGLEAGPLWLMGLGIEIMTWCAQAVAGMPGATGKVPAIPTLAFASVLVGGLWLALWRGRWRVWGLAPIVLGILWAPTGVRPDLLVGRDGELVAVRMPSGLLSATSSRGGNFELSRWLEHDGDARTPADAGKGEAWRCDTAGCTARLRGLTVAVAKSPAALRDDCQTADILILRIRRVGPCPSARLVIDRDAITRGGPHALFVEDARAMAFPLSLLASRPAGHGGLLLRLETVAAARGDRPWSVRTPEASRAIDAAAPPRGAMPESAE